MSITEFAVALGTSRPTYYSWLDGAEIGLKQLSVMAIRHVGEWRGELAVKLIRLTDKRLVPCRCETELFDNGPCPKHGTPIGLSATSPKLKNKINLGEEELAAEVV